MKTWKICATCILLAFLCLFSSTGYAALSGTLRVSGTAKNDIPYGLFITNVSTDTSSRIDKNNASYLEYSTTIDSTLSRTNAGAGSVTYNVTVLNNTKLTYTYRGIYYQTNLPGYNGNSYVSTSNNWTRSWQATWQKQPKTKKPTLRNSKTLSSVWKPLVKEQKFKKRTATTKKSRN